MTTEMNDSELSWEEIFSKQYKSSVLWSSNHEYLKYDNKTPYLHAINRQSLLFYNAALKTKKEAVLIYPSIELTITPLLALDAAYTNYEHKKDWFYGRDKLLIISDRLALRDDIRQRFLKFKATSYPLYITFPIGHVKGDGSTSFFHDITKSRKISSQISKKLPSILISPNAQTLPNEEISKEIYGVIIEASSAQTDNARYKIREWIRNSKVQSVLWLSSEPPDDYLIELIKSGKAIYWGWNQGELKVDSQKDEINYNAGVFTTTDPFCNSYEEIRNKFNGIEHYIIPVKERYLNQALKDCKTRYRHLLHIARNDKNQSEFSFARRYIGAIFAHEEILSPLDYIEDILPLKWGFVSVNETLESAEEQLNAIDSENKEFIDYGKESLDKLKEISEYFKIKKSGKHPVIYQLIIDGLKNNQKITIIAKNELLRDSLILFLDEKRNLTYENLLEHGITITDIKSYRDKKQKNSIDMCVICGCPRAKERHILSIAKARKIGIIAYESEFNELSYYLKSNKINTDILSSDKKGKRLKSLSILNEIKTTETTPISKECSKKSSDVIYLESIDAEMGDVELEEIKKDFIFEELAIDTECSSAYGNSPVFGDNNRKIEVNAVEVMMESGKTILLDKDKIVQIYDIPTEKVHEILVSKLKKGMELILVENSTRKTLLKSLLAKIETHPKIQDVILYQRQWVNHLCDDFIDSNDSVQTLIWKLHKEGATSPNTPIAIYSWLNGWVLGPKDNKNIQRIGIIYDDPYLIENWKAIALAIKRLRTIHVIFGKMLNKLIPRAGIKYNNQQTESTVIDEELDLYLEDFADIISIEKIESIRDAGIVSSTNLDRITINTENI